jgi:hypothetical protein
MKTKTIAIVLILIVSSMHADATDTTSIDGYIATVLQTFKSASPETLVVDTGACRSDRQKANASYFESVFRRKVFRKAKCFKEISAYWSKPLPNDDFTGIIILAFTPRDHKKVTDFLSANYSTRYSVMGYSYYKWYAFRNYLIFLQMFTAQGTPLLMRTDSLTKGYFGIKTDPKVIPSPNISPGWKP